MFQHELKNAYMGGNLLKAAYVGTNLVRPKWEPWANTLAYRPLQANINDYSWNWHNFSVNTWSVSYSNNMATISWRLTCTFSQLNNYSGDFTFSWWTVYSSTENWFYPCCIASGGSIYYPNTWFLIGNTKARFWAKFGGSNTAVFAQTDFSSSDTSVHLITWTKSSTELKLYLDGELVATNSWSFSSLYNSSTTVLWRNWATTSWSSKWGYLIVENRVWSAAEIDKYYRDTKWIYWIS